MLLFLNFLFVIHHVSREWYVIQLYLCFYAFGTSIFIHEKFIYLYILYLFLSSVESASILLIVWSKSIAPTRLLLFAPKTAVSCLVPEICVYKSFHDYLLFAKSIDQANRLFEIEKKITANIFDQSWIIVRSIYFRISRRKSLVVVETNANFRRHQWLWSSRHCVHMVSIFYALYLSIISYSFFIHFSEG